MAADNTLNGGEILPSFHLTVEHLLVCFALWLGPRCRSRRVTVLHSLFHARMAAAVPELALLHPFALSL